jgi:hypothetical protein
VAGTIQAPDRGRPRQPGDGRGRAFQTDACWWLSLIVLGGIGLNALFGRWWADPVSAIVMTSFLVKEA